MEIIAIQGHRKESTGKTGAKKIRRDGQAPAVMYKNGGGSDAIQFAVEQSDLRSLVFTPKFRMAEISLNGQTHKCIIKDIQFHPVTEHVVHIDFLELVPGVKYKATVPLRFVGTAPGVREGGKFIPTLRQVNILTTPETAVDEMLADITKMEMGATIRVRDITAKEGVEVTNPSSVPIALIEVPRALKGK